MEWASGENLMGFVVLLLAGMVGLDFSGMLWGEVFWGVEGLRGRKGLGWSMVEFVKLGVIAR